MTLGPIIHYRYETKGRFLVTLETTDALGHKALAEGWVRVLSGGASTLDASPALGYLGGLLTYRATLVNGELRSLPSSLALPLPEVTDYVAHQGGQFEDGRLTWAGDLPGDASFAASLTVRVSLKRDLARPVCATAVFTVGGESLERSASTPVDARALLPLVLKGTR